MSSPGDPEPVEPPPTGDETVDVSTPAIREDKRAPPSPLSSTKRRRKFENDDDDDDDGYHTPTSPRHRIQPSLECPPAPRRGTSTLRARKRAIDWDAVDSCRVIRRRVEVIDSIQLAFCRISVERGEFRQ